MHKHIIAFVFIVALATIITGCQHAPAHDEQKPAPVDVAERLVLKRDTMVTTLSVPGELVAFQQVDLYAKVTGFVKTLNVDIGSKVKAGEVLMTLEAPELAAQLSAAESRLKSQEALFAASKANYNRLLETSKTPGTISPNDLDIAEARKNADFANLEAAKASYKEVGDVKSYLVIRAPFEGKITARNVNIGAYVGPSGKGSDQPALTLQQGTKLRLVISVPERYASYLNQGDAITFTVRSHPGEVFNTTLKRLSGALDVKLRSQRAEADIDNRNGNLLPGTVVDVSATLSSYGVFVVPKSAVVNSAEGVYVVRVLDGKADRVAIKKGLEKDGMIEIYGALSENDAVLKKASDEIKQGQAI